MIAFTKTSWLPLKLRHFGVCALASAWVLNGCGKDTKQSVTVLDTAPVNFVDVTKRAQISFQHNSGRFGLKFFPEQLGAGVACFDFDSDGWPDLYFANGRDWTDAELAAYRSGVGKAHASYVGSVMAKRPKPRQTPGMLYRNNHDGTFKDVTSGSGLDKAQIYGMGVAAGDYDNDGRPDLYLTGYNGNLLFHNEGEGKFRDVTNVAGVRDAGLNTLSTSAMWLDYNRDGKLDLFVCHYPQWNPAIDFYEGTDTLKAASSPERYQPDSCRLFRNKGDGTFEDVSIKAGIRAASGASGAAALSSKALGVALCDFDNDLWPDIAVANDRMPNFLFRNNGNGTFKEVANRVGMAVTELGQARSGMGIDAADFDHSNRESFLIGNFAGEMPGLYRNLGNSSFSDIVPGSAIASKTASSLTFGVLFTDVNNDGWPDIFLANGHINDLIETARRDVTYAQQPLLFLNEGAKGKGNFRDISAESGDAFSESIVARALANFDFDLDGDDDIVMTELDGPPILLRNDGHTQNHAIRVTLRGTKSNRDAIGAVVWAETRVANKTDSVRRRVHSGSSYLAQSELPLTLGLGMHNKAKLIVRWPSGALEQLGSVNSGQSLFVTEGQGIVRRQMLRNLN